MILFLVMLTCQNQVKVMYLLAKKETAKQKSTTQLLDLAKGFVVNINVNVNK